MNRLSYMLLVIFFLFSFLILRLAYIQLIQNQGSLTQVSIITGKWHEES